MTGERKSLAATSDGPLIWSPEVKLFTEIGNLKVYKSDPSESQHQTVCYYLRSGENDLLRLESYKERYISISWESEITPGEFTELTEDYLSSFKDQLEGKNPELFSVILISDRGIEEYEYERPLQEEDLNQIELYKTGHEENLTLLRFNSPVGAFVIEPKRKNLGFITPLALERERQLAAISRMIRLTGPDIRSEILIEFLNTVINKEFSEHSAEDELHR